MDRYSGVSSSGACSNSRSTQPQVQTIATADGQNPAPPETTLGTNVCSGNFRYVQENHQTPGFLIPVVRFPDFVHLHHRIFSPEVAASCAAAAAVPCGRALKTTLFVLQALASSREEALPD